MQRRAADDHKQKSLSGRRRSRRTHTHTHMANATPTSQCSSQKSECRYGHVVQLGHDLRQEFAKPAVTPNLQFQQTVRDNQANLLQMLRQLLMKIITGYEQDANYGIHMVNRSNWKNTYFDPKVGLCLIEQPVMYRVVGQKLEQMASFLLRVLRLLDSGDVATKRDHVYTSGIKQDQIDALMDDICATIRQPRILLNTITSAGGLIFGDVRIHYQSGDVCHCTNSGNTPTSIRDCSDITLIQSPAHFVLVVEKDTVFTRLLTQSVPVTLNCIIVTGKGYSDLQTRRMVNLLFQFLRIPVLAVVDGDPHGADIMCQYRFGSLGQSYASHELATPQMRWCGFLPEDFGIKLRGEKTPFTERDEKKLQDLMRRPYVTGTPLLLEQLQKMQQHGHKYGLEQMCEVRSDFLSANYLPFCLNRGLFI